MSSPDINLPDQRLLEISCQVRDWREGCKIIPPFFLRAVPQKWRRTVEMKLNPPSITDLACEIVSLLHLEEAEQWPFRSSFFWRINNQPTNQQHLDIRRRISSKTPFWTDPNVKDDPKLLRELKQAEEGGKNLTSMVAELVESVFPEEDSSLVVSWLEVSRSAGANLGTVFYIPNVQPATLRHTMVTESGRISDVRAKVPLNVCTYINDGFRNHINPYLRTDN